VNVTNSTRQRIPRSRLRLMDTISDSEKAPGLLYEGELDGTSVIIKRYRRRRGGCDETEKVTRRLLTVRSLYLTLGVP
jgi:hypothetical protein